MYERYGELARATDDPTVMSGRHAFQAEAERRIPEDVARKLALSSEDRLLEVGCGPGNLLIPLAEQAASATGVDHPEVVTRLRQRPGGERVDVIAGDLLEVDLGGPYSKVLAYSVAHCLTPAGFDLMLDRLCAVVARGGRLMLGDLPNTDKKRRFLASESGREFEEEWRQRTADSPAPELAAVASTQETASFDDERLFGLLRGFRARGWESYLLPQPVDLPFGRTREDLVAVAPE